MYLQIVHVQKINLHRKLIHTEFFPRVGSALRKLWAIIDGISSS